LCSFRPLLYYHISTIQNPCVRVCRSACLIMYIFVCACVCVSLHSPRCSIRCIFKSDSTACLSYLMWNRVPPSHGSMYYCLQPQFGCYVCQSCSISLQIMSICTDSEISTKYTPLRIYLDSEAKTLFGSIVQHFGFDIKCFI
jgi:hypothetical protein